MKYFRRCKKKIFFGYQSSCKNIIIIRTEVVQLKVDTGIEK